MNGGNQILPYFLRPQKRVALIRDAPMCLLLLYLDMLIGNEAVERGGGAVGKFLAKAAWLGCHLHDALRCLYLICQPRTPYLVFVQPQVP